LILKSGIFICSNHFKCKNILTNNLIILILQCNYDLYVYQQTDYFFTIILNYWNWCSNFNSKSNWWCIYYNQSGR